MRTETAPVCPSCNSSIAPDQAFFYVEGKGYFHLDCWGKQITASDDTSRPRYALIQPTDYAGAMRSIWQTEPKLRRRIALLEAALESAEKQLVQVAALRYWAAQKPAEALKAEEYLDALKGSS